MEGEEKSLPESWKDWSEAEVLGHGSYGTVYKIKKSIQGREVCSACKVIDLPRSEEEWNRMLASGGGEEAARIHIRAVMSSFVRIIELISEMQRKSNLVVIEDFLTEEKENFGWRIAVRMEYLQNLSSYSQTHRLDEQEVIMLGVDICNALVSFEKNNMVHLDVKPTNLFFASGGQFKLGDFGIADYLPEAAGDYAAPEVWKGGTYGTSADLYSLGLVLYMLMNRNCLPFEDSIDFFDPSDETPFEKRIRGNEFPPPVNASEDLSSIIMKACAYNPRLRYQSAAEMRDALLSVQNCPRTKLNVQTEKTKAVKKSGRGVRNVFCGIGAIALLCAAFFGGYAYGIHRDASAEKISEAESENGIAVEEIIVVSGEKPETAVRAEKTYIVMAESANLKMREEPKKNGNVIGKIPNGETVAATGEKSDNWLQISYSFDGSEEPEVGWVPLKYLSEVIEPAKEPSESESEIS